MTTETILTDAEKANFVADIIGYGTDFVAPIYAVVESIEQAVLQSPEIQALKHNQKLLVEMPEESNSLLVACAHEKRPWKEIQEQLGMNRAAINAAMEKQK